LGATLTTENVVDVLNLAAEGGSERLEVCCSEFIGQHVQDVIAGKTLSRLRPETLRKLLEQSILPGTLVAQPVVAPPVDADTSTADGTALKEEASEGAVEAVAKPDTLSPSQEVKESGQQSPNTADKRQDDEETAGLFLRDVIPTKAPTDTVKV
jgi:hypothetical protein